jgi:hypothetical protein
MKKYFTLILMAGLTACNTSKSTLNDKAKSQTLSGDFRSTQGVMQPVSCYCFESGYLQTNTERVPLCFPSGTTLPSSGKITVMGNFAEREHKGSDIDPCPSGKMTVFEVKSFKSN